MEKTDEVSNQVLDPSTIKDLTVLNYPIKTHEALNMWGAAPHICNIVKAIIATSYDLHNANDNLRRYGYSRGWRTKALYHYGKYVNKPDMAGIPITPLSTPHYVECHYVEGVSLTTVLAGNVAP